MLPDLLQFVISTFESLARVMPLELYVLIGSFFEEIIAPIPQSLVVGLAGTLAEVQDYALQALLVLAFLSALGKTLAGWILYIIGDKAEHIVIGKFGKFLGVTEKDITKWSTYINKGNREVFALTLARLIPIIPTAPVSVVSGILKLPVRMFLLISVAGLTVRNALFIYLGYIGVSSYETLTSDRGSIESIGKITVFVLLLGFFMWVGYRATKKYMRELETKQKK